MFDVGFWELAIIGVVALVIVGPDRLPGLARTAGLWVGKGRRMLADVKRDIDREIKASEMDDLKDLKKDIDEAASEVKKAGENITKESGVEDLKQTFKDAAPGDGGMADELKSEVDELDQVSKEFSEELNKSVPKEESANADPAKEV